MKQITATIISCTGLMPGVFLIWVDAPEIAVKARPGQFVTVRCGEDVLLRRPLSIHRIQDGKLALLFAVVGQGTEWLANRKAGESLDILGPLGNGFTIHPDSKKLLLVAGGIGIAPLVALADKAVAAGFSVKLLMGAASDSYLYSLKIDGVETTCATEDGSLGDKGMITHLIAPYALWADQIFACGPIPMYRTIAQMDAELGRKSVQVILEQAMGCGVGACRGCAVHTDQGMKSVCQDGPVFDLREIVWEEVVEPGTNRIIRSA